VGRVPGPSLGYEQVMSVIFQIVIVGLIVGAIARLLIPGRDPIGLLGTLGVGVGGAFLGWWAGRQLVSGRSVHQHPWLWAIGGAVVVLLVVRALSRRGGLIGRRRWGW
jgi:uncharacterized membrane protein YeaQ/YmgE (transglycosylase-associated protein family)